MSSSSPLAGKRICATGGGGFLGSFVVEELQRRGCRDIFVPRRNDYDLTNTAAIERLFADARPEVLFASRPSWAAFQRTAAIRASSSMTMRSWASSLLLDPGRSAGHPQVDGAAYARRR